MAQQINQFINHLDFDQQFNLSEDVVLNFFQGEDRIHPASRINSTSQGANFRLTGASEVSPYFAIAYAFWACIRRAVIRMGPQHKLQEFMMYLAMKRPNEEDPNYNRLQFRVAITPAILQRAEANLPMNRAVLRMLAPEIGILLSEEHYSEIDVTAYSDLIDGDGVLGRRATIVRFSVDTICFFRRAGRGEGTAVQRAQLREASIRADITQRTVGHFGGKRKMFYKGTDVQFHTEATQTLDCLAINPLMEGQWCFPMAFLVSQVREYSHNPELKERLSHPLDLKTLNKSNDSYPYIRIPYTQPGRSKPVEFVRGTSIFLFNPIQPVDINVWEQTAEYLHQHVEMMSGNSIDHTSWKETPQAYSDVFQVVIHLFIKGFSNRFDVYTPTVKPSIIRHIYMYCDDEHFQPVIDIRKFTSSRAIKPFTWCDYCQKNVTGELSSTRSDHIALCHSNYTFVSEPVNDFLRVADEVVHKPLRKGGLVKQYCNEHRVFDCECMNFEVGNKTSEHTYFCNVCNQEGPYSEFAYKHRCMFKKPEIKEALPNEKLFVLDIESLQNTVVNGKSLHEFVLMCVRNIYSEFKKEYLTMELFLDDCLNLPDYKDSTFIAHNGGGYDYQFIIKSVEALGWNYSMVPRPGSDHKYISLTLIMDDFKIEFIDFMCLIPGSLKGIAQSFQLEVQKGDFPHRFLTKTTLDYIGAIPPLNTSEDYYSLAWKKSEKDVAEVKEWFQQQSLVYCTCFGECSCIKKKWNCREFLTEYCWLDVDVLAKACQKYRDLLMKPSDVLGAWNRTPIDPFQYLTQSQLAMQIFLTGFTQIPNIGVIIPRKISMWKEFVWYYRLSIQEPHKTFIHYGTNTSRYLNVRDNIYYDCFCIETNTIYEFIYVGQEQKHRGNVITFHENDLGVITPLEVQIATLADDRDFFFGGRTEVFSPYAKPVADEEIKYLDVCSLYPTICSFAMLPIGHPIISFGHQCSLDRLNKNHPDAYFGFVRCRVIPNKYDLIGLLPSKMESGKLIFDLNDKVGMWFTEEIYLAMQYGYQIVEIYEVHHFDSLNRSDTLMRGYMESFLSLKQEAEGWKKLGASCDTPSDEEQDRIIAALFEANGRIGNVRKASVMKNPVLRQVSKIFLNCLWGKFCQRKKSAKFTELTSYKDYEAVLALPESAAMTFRQMSPGRWRVKYDQPDHKLPVNRKYNIYLAAGVTAQARCYLHRQMFNIGPERILYCDTDSIVFTYPRLAPTLTGFGLGKWTDEHPGEIILDFMAIAPKCYMLHIDGDTTMKAKGCIMSIQNQKILSHEIVKRLIQSYCIQKQLENITLQNFSIFTNSTDINYSYASMFSRYNTKQVRCILNKRQLITQFLPDDLLGESIMRVSLLPDGFILM